MRFQPQVLLIFLAVSCAATAQDTSIPISDKSYCMEGPLAEFGQYIGNWEIADSRLSQDGSTWTAGPGAQWNFVCLGGGTAVQDYWMPNGGPVGTNLRTYNNDEEKWDIAWAIKGQPGYARIEARKDAEENIVMHHVAPIPNPIRQITFYPASRNSWRWTLEISSDGGENWIEVYRIQATRSP